MKRLGSLLYCQVLFGLNIFGSILAVEEIKWVSIEDVELLQLGVDPAGLENGRSLYLARAYHFDPKYNDHTWLPGKLQVAPGKLQAVAVAEGEEHIYPDFEILVGPPGALSWLPDAVKGHTYPYEPVYAGVSRGGRNIRICRAPHSWGHLIPGVLMLPSSTPSDTCTYGFNGTEYVRQNQYEILTVNKLGQLLRDSS